MKVRPTLIAAGNFDHYTDNLILDGEPVKERNVLIVRFDEAEELKALLDPHEPIELDWQCVWPNGT